MSLGGSSSEGNMASESAEDEEDEETIWESPSGSVVEQERSTG